MNSDSDEQVELLQNEPHCPFPNAIGKKENMNMHQS